MGRKEERVKSVYLNLKREFADLETLFIADAAERGAGATGWLSFPPRDEPSAIGSLSASSPGPLRESTSDFFYIGEEGLGMVAAFPAGRRNGPGTVEAAKMAARYCLKMAESEYDSLHDALTGIHNKAFFDRTLRGAIAWLAGFFASAPDEDHPLESVFDGKNVGLILFDIDNFKSFNDVYGHRAGDAVLRATAIACENALVADAGAAGGEVSLCRYGGEEFAVITRGVSAAGIERIAEKVRKAVEAVDTDEVARKIGLALKLRKVTVSAGTAEYNLYSHYCTEPGPPDAEKIFVGLIERSDMALYAAKRLGKNRVAAFGEIAGGCSAVIDRIGPNAMVTAGYATGASFGDVFEVYDSRYDGKSDIVDPATSKKIGVYPRYVKGTLSVKPDFTRFDQPLMERVCMCEISESPGTPIGAGDRCHPVPRPERELHNDVFLPLKLTGVAKYFPAGDEEVDFSLAAMASAGESFSELRQSAGDESVAGFFAMFASALERLSVGGRAFRLSSDRALLLFGECADSERKEGEFASAFAEITDRFGLKNTIRVSFLSGRAGKPLSLREACRRLRLTDLGARFFGKKGRERYGPAAHRNYALFLYLCGRAGEALSELLKCEGIFGRGSDPAIFEYVGNIAMKTGDLKLSEEYLLEAEKSMPGNALVLGNLALLYFRLGDLGRAAAFYEKCLLIEPGNPTYLNNLAYTLLVSRGDLAAARRHCQKALSLCDETRRANFTDTLAAVCAAEGDHAGAAGLYGEVVKMESFFPRAEVLVNLARELLACSDTAGAWKALRRARSHPDAERLKSAIDELVDAINLARHGE